MNSDEAVKLDYTIKNYERLSAIYGQCAEESHNPDYITEYKEHSRRNAQVAEWLKNYKRLLEECQKQPKIIKCKECESRLGQKPPYWCEEWKAHTHIDGYCHLGKEKIAANGERKKSP